MGGSSSKHQATSVISVDANFPAIVDSKDDKAQEIRNLVKNIDTVLKKMKKEVEGNSLLPNSLFRGLFNDLESLNRVLNPERMHVCYVIGGACAGKSSLINSITGDQTKCNVSRTAKAGTINFKIIYASKVNTTFVDTIGFGSKFDDSELIKRFKTELEIDHRPDSILLCVTQEQLRNIALLEHVIGYINKLVQRAEGDRHNNSVPIICVLNKIDQYFPEGLPDFENHRENMEEHLRDALEKVNEFLRTKAILCIATSALKNYGIDQLRSSIDAHSPLNAQIIDKNLDYAGKHRLIIANKIIAAFSTASAAVSFLPLVDIAVVTILQEWMYKMLACLSVDSNRTPETYKTVHRTLQVSSLAIRVGSFFVGGIFQLSLIGYLIGSSVCVVAAASSTAALGWACYCYFVGKTPKEEHEKLK